jgi:hypothetical protein
MVILPRGWLVSPGKRLF